jgi:arylsulfatase A-like enzyme
MVGLTIPNPAAAAEKPNVLIIAIDDMNDWTTLFDKTNPIKTPNLDRLAAQGTFFSRAYCAVAACNPSRTAILTGYSPDTTGCYENSSQRWKSSPDEVNLPQYRIWFIAT